VKILSGAGLDVAGHKVPWTALGALAAILGAFLIWKFNQAGGVSAGAVPSGSQPSIDMGGSSVFGADQESAIANLSQQISDLGARIPTAATAPAATPGSAVNAYGVAPAVWRTYSEHQKEFLKAHPGVAVTKTWR